jgi:lipopolysaccharide transport system permease protein
MTDLARQTLSFAKIQLKDRYLGTSIGIIWTVLNPVIMLSLYTFIFGFVLQSKAPGAETSFAYALWMISGLGPWLSISESLNGATGSVVGNGGLIKNMAFKSESLPLAAAITGLIPLGVSLAFLLCLSIYAHSYPTWHLAILPWCLFVHVLFVCGLSLIFSTINVFFRDFGVVLSNLLMILLFGTPIFYSIDQFPVVLQKVSRFNPFYIVTNNYREILINHHVPDVQHNIYLLAVSLILFYFGLRFFRRLKGFFEGVL